MNDNEDPRLLIELKREQPYIMLGREKDDRNKLFLEWELHSTGGFTKLPWNDWVKLARAILDADHKYYEERFKK